MLLEGIRFEDQMGSSKAWRIKRKTCAWPYKSKIEARKWTRRV